MGSEIIYRRSEPTLSPTLAGRLFVVAVAFAIFQDLPISIWAMANNLPTQPHKYEGFSAITSFYWIKTIKYLFFCAALFVSIRGGFAFVRMNRQAIVFATLILVGVMPSLIIGLSELPWQYWVAGSKAWFPLLALIVGLMLIKNDVELLKKVLDYGIIVNLIVAVAQQIHGAIACPIPGVGCINLIDGYRSTGTFSEPNTMAAMVVARLILALNSRLSILQIVLWGGLLALSTSRSSIALFLAILMFFIFGGDRKRSHFIIVLAIILGFLIVSRGMDGLAERVEIFNGYLYSNSWLWGNGFGAGTLSMEAVGHLDMGRHLTQFPTDSMFASLMSQGGAWLLFCFCAAFIYLFFNIGEYKSKIAIFAVFSMGAFSVIFEVWPLNILLLSLLGMALRESNLAKSTGRTD